MGTTPQTAMRTGMRVIISGASTGIGKAMAIQLSKEYKAKVIMNARGEDDLQKAAEEVKKAGGEAKCVVGDVSDESVSTEMIKQCNSEFGGIDALVNNAGLARSGPMTGLSLNDWRYVFEVNFFAALNLTYKALPNFLDQGFGKVVNIASVAGKVSFPGSVCYASSKFALTGFSEGMAAEFAGKFDTITVCPG
ncbi:MAG TPA: SDR family oxidoreductase [Candidatus Melainabacteria bacterium]|nr:SDR family oxidoreductase [Candidatus Melainabacteria bacterium]